MAYIPAASAAAKRRRETAEEEEMATYETRDLAEDWEFKIVRSASGEFEKPAVFQALVEEEAQAGWELVEKFDRHRIRFKRSRRARERDQWLPEGVDPYRTQYGWSPERLALVIVTSVLLALVGVALAGTLLAQ